MSNVFVDITFILRSCLPLVKMICRHIIWVADSILTIKYCSFASFYEPSVVCVPRQQTSETKTEDSLDPSSVGSLARLRSKKSKQSKSSVAEVPPSAHQVTIVDSR